MRLVEKNYKLLIFIVFALLLHINIFGEVTMQEEFKIAFIADAHFHDVYAEFKDDSFEGLKNSITGKNSKIRTMEAQLTSTRLFNENYYALNATLEDLAGKDIKYVGLVGDFSDDGQIIHLRGLKKILDSYTKKYGIQFFAIPGNHDPVKPVDNPNGKSDFLGKGGQEQRIFSKGAKECINYSGKKAVINTGKGLPTICTEEILELGYTGIINEMGKYGFYPQKDYLYWATPYSTYNYEMYNYEKAVKESVLSKRTYEECFEGTGGKYKKENYTNCLMVEDSTYLVEPIKGIWLLAIDANVYVPTKEINNENHKDPQNFVGSSNAGYNKMISHKTQTVDWIAEVVKKANEEGKILITFSHFPMVDFYDNNSKILEEIFGEGKLDLKRIPTEDTEKIMAKTGVRLNIAGHLHFNDTGVRKYDSGEFLVNVQVPSLAAYVPGYKILTVKNKNLMEVETVEIKDVPRFNELFEHYKVEHQYLSENNPSKNWNEKILESKDYGEFADWHLVELTRKRFLPQWPADLQEMLKTMSGKDILIYTQLKESISISDLEKIKEGKGNSLDRKTISAWNDAEKRAQNLAKKNNLNLNDFESWNGFDLAVDFYRMMNADELALKYIDTARINEYSVIYNNVKDKANKSLPNERFNFYFSRLFTAMNNFSNSEPSDKFVIDFDKKQIIDLKNNTNRIK
ncbi:MAG: metallophosphoesterase [Sebaldella sp.]|nr:metallophosphoesterase [Sebaldella sp.]